MLKNLVISFLSKQRKKAIEKWSRTPIQSQDKILKSLIKTAKKTLFGKDHNFSKIKTYEDYKKNIPIVDYEGIKKYINKIIAGEKDVLWPGRPKYFAITSGTTSGAKYIPITTQSIPHLMGGAKDALLMYIANTGNTSVLSGKHLFLQGSPVLDRIGGIKTGRLSGISAHHYPFFLNLTKRPSYKTNCIADWEEKVGKIVDETVSEDMRILSGIPSWLQMYFEKLQERESKPIGKIFKNFKLLIYGGVSYRPYKNKFDKLIGRKIDSVEVYPASEGFFAFQDRQESNDLLLLLNSGIFYEFISERDYLNNKQNRISLKDVEQEVNYVLIISTNAGLWGYNTGDTIMFTSKKPYRIVVTGRIKQFLSAFGEHVIVNDVEKAIEEACSKTKIIINEFTVAPKFGLGSEKSCHEWFIDFEIEPRSLEKFAKVLDIRLQSQNKYYKDLIKGNVINSLKIKRVLNNGFNIYMKSIGKLGGQNKIPKLSNDRTIADRLYKLNLVKNP
tara:strand:- start:479 stop:1981 length:1503 start_codon:yes stop_codon:yes gene_type:complete